MSRASAHICDGCVARCVETLAEEGFALTRRSPHAELFETRDPAQVRRYHVVLDDGAMLKATVWQTDAPDAWRWRVDTLAGSADISASLAATVELIAEVEGDHPTARAAEQSAQRAVASYAVLREWLPDGIATREQLVESVRDLDVALGGVRDYKIAAGGSNRLHTASPFNIKVESLTMRDFTAAEVAELYAQHTAETGQRFEPDALARAFDLTRSQPWLVNALARQSSRPRPRSRDARHRG
jgi:hypothetical protein